MYFLYCSFFYLFFHFLLLFFLFYLGNDIFFTVDWLLNSSGFFDYTFLLDYVSLGFLSFVFFIVFCVMKYSFIYMGETSMSKRFITLVNLFVFSMGLLIISPNFLCMMVGWDGLGVISFLLVIYYNNFTSLNSGLVTIYLNRFGDYFMVLSFWFLYKEVCVGLYSFYYSSVIWFSVLFILLAGMTKSAQLPFSSWLPAAMAAPTPVSSLVHSSTLVTAGVYIMIRFFYVSEVLLLMDFLMWISLLTCLGAGIVACYENDLKKLVAMSTLSQLGLMIFVYSLGEVFYTYYHMVCHALFKALLFLGCGLCIMYMYGSQESRFVMNLGSLAFCNIVFIFISVLSLMGFPFLTGFYSKDSIMEICFLTSPIFVVYLFMLLACILTGVYGLKGVYIILKTYNNSHFCYSGFQSYMTWFGMFALSMWSILLGKFYSIFHMKLENSILFFYVKTMGLLVIFFGVSLFFFLSWSKILYYYMKSFFGDLYFLNWFFGNFSSKSLELFVWSFLGDLTWLLMLGPKMVFSFFYNFSYVGFSLESGLSISFLLVSFFLFTGNVFVFSLFLKCWIEALKNFYKIFLIPKLFMPNIFIINSLYQSWNYFNSKYMIPYLLVSS